MFNEILCVFIHNSLHHKLAHKIKNLRITYIAVLFTIILFLPFFFSQRLSDTYIMKRQNEKIMQIGNSQVNQLLYTYFKDEKHKDDKKILTNYQYLGFLPKLQEKYQLVHLDSLPSESVKFKVYLSQLQNYESGYILYMKLMPENTLIKEDIEKRIKNGNYEVIFNEGAYKFIKIIR